jgi:hypothetical protein
VRGNRYRRRGWFLALLPRVIPRDGETKKFKVSLRGIRDHAFTKA